MANDKEKADERDHGDADTVETAQELGDAAASGLSAACTTVGDNVKQALATGGEEVDQALAQTAEQCKSSVSQLPQGEAQDALTDLCGAIEAG